VGLGLLGQQPGAGERVVEFVAVPARPDVLEKLVLVGDQLAQLGGDCRKVLNLFFAGESMENIAQALGYASAGYAKKRKFQCKKQLIGLIREDRRYEELSG